MQSFQSIVQDDFKKVNQLIINRLESNVDLVENIGQYLIEAGGKRLRPTLVMLCAGALNHKSDAILSMAAIIEFIHTATLLHDDVVDVSELRRGRPTANAKWGNAPSVLVGDFIYSRAFQMMVELNSLAIMGEMASTTNTISEGEVQQLVNANNPAINEAQYLDVIHKKTAILFEAACETSAILAGATPEKTKALRTYAYHLGVTFQLMDDVLDYEGDSDTLGKNIGDDLGEGKPTLPLIYAMAHANNDDANIIKKAIENGDDSALDDVIRIVQESGGIDYTKQCAQKHIDSAIESLNLLENNDYIQAMKDLANFSLGRTS